MSTVRTASNKFHANLTELLSRLLLPWSGVVNVDGVNPDVRVENVFVQEDGAAGGVGNVDMVHEALVLEILDRCLQCNNVPFTYDVLLNGTLFAAFQLGMLIRVCSSKRFGTGVETKFCLGESAIWLSRFVVA